MFKFIEGKYLSYYFELLFQKNNNQYSNKV